MSARPAPLPAGAAGLLRLAEWHEHHAETLADRARDMERGGLYGDALETMRAHIEQHQAWAADLRRRAEAMGR